MADTTSLAVSSATMAASSATVRASSTEMEKPGEIENDKLDEASELGLAEDDDDDDETRATLVDVEDTSKSCETVQPDIPQPHEDQQHSSQTEDRSRSESPDLVGIFGLDSITNTDSKVLPKPGSHDGAQRSFASTSETLPASSAPTSAYSFRDRGTKQKKLVYDLKYHPMDDSTRPSHAAKRRLAHGEQLPSSDDSSDCFSVRTDADTQPRSDDSFEGANTGKKRVSKQVKQDKKRARKRSRSPPAPTRRSNRRTSDEKKFYDMSMHPQDDDLELLSSDDEEVSMSLSKRRKMNHKKGSDSDATLSAGSKSMSRRSKPIVVSSDPGPTSTDDEDGIMAGDALDAIMQTEPEDVTCADSTPDEHTSPTPSISTPSPHGVRRRESLEVWKLMPGERYFRHDRDSWPYTPGLPFDIWDEQKEDQIAQEALAMLPLNYEHDDKENQLENAEQQSSDTLEGIAVIPASQYRGSHTGALDAENHGLAREALYEDRTLDLDTYGLSTDGAYDEEESCRKELGCNIDIMRLLASGAHLPRGSIEDYAWKNLAEK